MPFPSEAAFTKTPTEIGAIRIILFQRQGSTVLDAASVDYQVKDQFDLVLSDARGIDLIPHLTDPQKVTLLSVITGIRNKLVSEVLP